jgi:hypothetical protein
MRWPQKGAEVAKIESKKSDWRALLDAMESRFEGTFFTPLFRPKMTWIRRFILFVAERDNRIEFAGLPSGGETAENAR